MISLSELLAVSQLSGTAWRSSGGAVNLVMHSERLILTPFEQADADIALELFTDPEVLRFAGGVMTTEDVLEDMPNWIRRGGNGCIGIWCIRLKESGEKLGTVALLPMPIEQDDTDWNLLIPGQLPEADFEVGYFLKKATWGKGYATEACKRLLQLAFQELPLSEIVATFDEGNDSSRNVLLKAGFIDHGIRRCYDEEGPDFRITREEWMKSDQSR